MSRTTRYVRKNDTHGTGRSNNDRWLNLPKATVIAAIVTAMGAVIGAYILRSIDVEEAFEQGLYEGLRQNSATAEQLRIEREEGFAEGLLEGSTITDTRLITEFNLGFEEGHTAGLEEGHIAGFEEGVNSITSSCEDSNEDEDEPLALASGEISLFSYSPLNYNRSSWNPNTGSLVTSLGVPLPTSNSFIIVNANRRGISASWAEYFIDGQYSYLRGRIAPHEGMDSNFVGRMLVYQKIVETGEEQLVDIVGDLGQRDAIMDFEVNIEGIRFLIIRFEHIAGSPGSFNRLLLTDVMLVP